MTKGLLRWNIPTKAWQGMQFRKQIRFVICKIKDRNVGIVLNESDCKCRCRLIDTAKKYVINIYVYLKSE